MRSITIVVPENIGTIIFKMGTLPHPAIPTLTAEEVVKAEAARKAEHGRINAEHGTDFVGAVRKGMRDDGVQVLKGEALFTGDLVDQLEVMGYYMVDAYTTTGIKQGVEKSLTTVIFSNQAECNTRLTMGVEVAASSMLDSNWFQSFIWLNALAQVPNMTINVFGNLVRRIPSRLVLVTVPAEVPKA